MKDSIMIIYKTTNLLNGKIYVGKDSNNNEHYLGSGIKLIRAIRKYGRENFKKEILEVCDSEGLLAEREKYWILEYDAQNRKTGYNIAEGGKGGNTRAGYTIKEMSNYRTNISKGLKNSEKFKEVQAARAGRSNPKHSATMKELYASGKLVPHNKGKTTPPEIAKKIGDGNRGKKLSTETKQRIAASKYKPIDQYNLDGTYVKSYDSIKHASEELNIGRDSIYGCCVGKYRQGGGFIWKYNIR